MEKRWDVYELLNGNSYPKDAHKNGICCSVLKWIVFARHDNRNYTRYQTYLSMDMIRIIPQKSLILFLRHQTVCTPASFVSFYIIGFHLFLFLFFKKELDGHKINLFHSDRCHPIQFRFLKEVSNNSNFLSRSRIAENSFPSRQIGESTLVTGSQLAQSCTIVVDATIFSGEKMWQHIH